MSVPEEYSRYSLPTRYTCNDCWHNNPNASSYRVGLLFLTFPISNITGLEDCTAGCDENGQVLKACSHRI